MTDSERVNREERRDADVALQIWQPIVPAHWRQFELLLRQPRFEQRSPLWLEMRHSGITSSDLGAALGISPFETPMHFIRKKCGVPLRAFSGNANTSHGTHYEDVALRVYESLTKNYVFDFGLLFHHELFNHPYAPLVNNNNEVKQAYVEDLHSGEVVGDGVLCLKGSPDGVTWCPRRQQFVVVEIKCPTSVERFYPCQVPEHYMPQLMQNMFLTGMSQTDFVQFIPARNRLETERLDVTTVHFDSLWMDSAVRYCIALWEEICLVRRGAKKLSDVIVTPPTLPPWSQAEIVKKR